jgi:DNA-binding response OmpR family regulator
MLEEPGRPHVASSRKRILVVDDEPEVSAVVVQMLKRNGFDGWAINDPPEVPERSAEIRPDLLILDYEMPALRGPELSVLLKSRKETSRIPVIFLSGMTDADSHPAGSFSGAAIYLDKPIDEGKLVAIIRRLMDRE